MDGWKHGHAGGFVVVYDQLSLAPLLLLEEKKRVKGSLCFSQVVLMMLLTMKASG